MTATLEPLTIRSGQGDYRVEFPASVADAAAAVAGNDRAFFLVDEHVASLYADQLGDLLAARPTHRVPATEDEKTLEGVGRFLTFLQENNATKQAEIVAIGGGIVQDIATFAAHLYYRGIKWTFLPTTLLAMCDSSIGAKCGINLNRFKNQLGVFQSPARVVIAEQFLETLADADVQSGYGEIVKLALTGSREDFDFLVEAVDGGGLRNEHLSELIQRSLRVKQGVIEEDEYEGDLRRILNYGHTFGHALEALTDHAIPHGTAVAWGCDLINFLSRERGLLAPEDYDRIHGFIARHWTFPLDQDIDAAALIDGTRRDKKVVDGQLTLILLAEPGDLRIVKTAFDDRLADEVGRYLATDSVVRRA
jgi:3-dehydroquinate synthase